MQYMKTAQVTREKNFSTVGQMFLQTVEKHRTLSAYSFRRTVQEEMQTKTYGELYEDVLSLGEALANFSYPSCGPDGYPVTFALVGENSYEWAVSYLTILSGLGTAVPLDRQLPAKEAAQLVVRAEASVFFFTPAMKETALLLAKREDNPVRYFVCLDTVRRPSAPLDLPEDDRFFLYSDLLEKGKNKREKYPLFVAKEDDLALLLFTSGTTNDSKGVLLTHKNICSNLHQISFKIHLEKEERLLSVLPMHHTFENTTSFLYALSQGAHIFFMDGLRYLANNLKDWKISVLVGVPLLFENIYKRVDESIEKSGKKNLVNLLRPLGRGFSTMGLNINRTLFKAILKAFGGKLRLFVSGAAPLSAEVIRGFKDFGIDCRQGYGLTETSPVISVTSADYKEIGSVGETLPGIQVAIDTEEEYLGAIGEVLTKSDSVMKGYFRNEEATQEVFTEDGWFRTGDLGYLDVNNCLHITGRCKTMIVLENGKKVFPEECEECINAIPLVAESFVWGLEEDKEVHVCAVLKLQAEEVLSFFNEKMQLTQEEKESLKEMLKQGTLLPSPYAELLSSHLKESLSSVSASMPAFKRIRYFLYTQEDFIKTTTLKIRRLHQKNRVEAFLQASGMKINKMNGKEMKG